MRFKFRRPRGRPRTALDEGARFNRDPNRIAAAIAADWMQENNADMKRSRGRPSKAVSPDRSLHDEAADHAIAWLAEVSPELKPNKDVVLELLRRGRTAWPKGAGTAFEFDLIGDLSRFKW
jgi:hypothetical protein